MSKKESLKKELKKDIKAVEEKSKELIENVEKNMIHERKEESDYILKDIKSEENK